MTRGHDDREAHACGPHLRDHFHAGHPGHLVVGDEAVIVEGLERFPAGGTVGANLQFGAGVIGLEGDIMWSSLDVSEAGYYTGDYYVMHSDWDWLATLRARAGVAVDRALIYVTGGLAIVDRKNSFCYEDPCGSYDDGYWALSAGAE